MTAHQEHDTDSTARNAGLVIALTAIASIVAVALDVGAQGSDVPSLLQSMVKIRETHQLVHIVAMACIGGLTYGFTVLAQRLGLRRAPVLAGLIAYSAGSMLMLVATTIDGFISTDTAALFATKTPEAVRVGYWMIQTMAGVALTDIARVAWVCQSVAALAWAWALLREGGWARVAGLVGMVSGALPAIAVVAVGQQMSATVVAGILLAQAIWNLTAATYLLRAARLAPAAGTASASGRAQVNLAR
ncbi:MAG TPA: hypothetical protein VFS02_25540 [Telluria sp.]|nr:hypothetical protein [Telluria sp.]